MHNLSCARVVGVPQTTLMLLYSQIGVESGLDFFFLFFFHTAQACAHQPVLSTGFDQYPFFSFGKIKCSELLPKSCSHYSEHCRQSNHFVRRTQSQFQTLSWIHLSGSYHLVVKIFLLMQKNCFHLHTKPEERRQCMLILKDTLN